MKPFIFLNLGFVFLASCGNDVDTKTSDLVNDSTQTHIVKNVDEAQIIEPKINDDIVKLAKEGIELIEIKSEISQAKLTLNTTTFKEGINQLSFSVEGVHEYQLAYLSNNNYLSTFSSDVVEMEFLYGNNVFLAFLTDKNGISIKSNQGSVLKNAVIGDMENLFNMNQPHLFYYLPKAETDHPILDFYLLNTKISHVGNKVKVTINGVEFIIKKWAAYEIVGFKKANNTIRIQLIDKNGNLIDGPFNDSGERRFSLIDKSI